MAGEPEGNRVRADDGAHGPRRFGAADVAGEPTVAPGLATRDLAEGEEDRLLEVAAGREVDGEAIQGGGPTGGVVDKQGSHLGSALMRAVLGTERAQFGEGRRGAPVEERRVADAGGREGHTGVAERSLGDHSDKRGRGGHDYFGLAGGGWERP